MGPAGTGGRVADVKRWSVEAHLWPIPRPYFETGWELDHIWIAFVIGNRHTDDVLSICWQRDLGDRSLKALTWVARKLGLI